MASSPTLSLPTAGDDPFALYRVKLAGCTKRAQSGLAPHHVAIDAVRIMEDVLVQVAACFVEHHQPPTVLANTGQSTVGSSTVASDPSFSHQ